MNPLVAPGDYNIGYNQTYLLARLSLEWFQTVAICAFIFWVFYKFYTFCRQSSSAERRRDSVSRLKKETLEDLKVISTIVKYIEDDKMLFGSDVTVLKRRYYKDLNECMLRLSGCDDLIFIDGSLRPYAADYSKAKALFMEWS